LHFGKNATARQASGGSALMLSQQGFPGGYSEAPEELL
jgi:hypothetical protein